MNTVSATTPYIEMTPTEPFDVAALLKELA
ncbi:hypothetical protein EDF18_0239 [Frigoribacterium sp. PhB107]|nr:hypothetical protein EDF18_0239 [Frigoribacterium sp. PhB107]